jgi:O-antigen/teichoic acid export membrane protein
MANPIKSLLGQTAIYGVSSIVGRLINYLLVPFYTYIFATNKFGVVTELIAYVTILVVLLTYGMETAFFRFCQNDNYSRRTIYSTSIGSLTVSSLFFILIIFVFGYRIADLIGYDKNPEFVILLGLTVTLDAFASIPFAKLRIENKAKRFAIVKLANIMMNVFFNIFFLFVLPHFFGTNNFIYRLLYKDISVGYIFISYFLSSLVTLFILYPELKAGLFKFNIDWSLLKKMLIYGFPILLTGLAGMFNESFDRILMKYLIVVPQNILSNITGSAEKLEASNVYIMGQLGIYGASVRVAVVMAIFFQAFRYAAEPFFFNYSKNVDSRLIYAKVMKYFVIFSLFIFVGVTLSLDILKYILGPSYRSGLAIVPMLFMSKIFFGIVFNLSIWYKLKDLTKYGTYIAFVGTTFSLTLNIILVPIFGYIGAAWASVISYFMMMVVSFILEKKYFAIPYDYFSIAFYFAIAFVLYFISYCVKLFTEYYLILNFLLIFAFVYIFIKKEKIKLKSIVLELAKYKKPQNNEIKS